MVQADTIRELAQKGCPVFYFYSGDGYLARRQSAAAREVLLAGETEATVLDDAAPNIEAVVMAAGTISFFGTRRLVQLPNLDPAAYTDEDLAALCDLLQSAENAVFLLTSVCKVERGKAVLGKRMQKLAALCRKLGYVQEVAKPTGAQLRQMLCRQAADQGADLSDAVARALVERSGEDVALLENEVDKLCALAGYGTVTAKMVGQLGTASLEADVFEMIRLTTAKNAAAACQKLHQLLLLQNEPIAIAAAMISSYVDMYRVKAGQAARRSYSAVFADYGYRGSDYRLKRSLQTAAPYTLAQLEECLEIVTELDGALKGSPLPEQTLLETALCQLCLVGGRR